MNSRHWDDDELIASLYGLGPKDRHLEVCEECAARWRSLRAVREREKQTLAVSEELLAGQRQAVYRRLERGGEGRRWFTLAPVALATAAVVLLAVVMYRPSPVPSADPSDAELFAETYSLVQSDEPEAVEWMHGLFETEVTQ